MTTECNQEPFPFHPLNQREVRGQFDGGAITSDAGGLLLREVEKRTNIIGQFASCFSDYRDPELVEHGVDELVGQRIYGLALGYEDLNDHEELRRDPTAIQSSTKEDCRAALKSRTNSVRCKFRVLKDRKTISSCNRVARPHYWDPALSEPDVRLSFSSGSSPSNASFRETRFSIRKDVGGEPCRGTLDEVERGYL